MKRIFNQPQWPKPNARLEAALGRFLIAWNLLEQELNFAIQISLRQDYTTGLAVTANLGTKAKIDMFQALAHQTADWVLDAAFLTKADALAAETGAASGNLRNFLFHGYPLHFDLSKKRSRLAWAKFAARKGGIRGHMMLIDAASIQKQTDTIRSLVERWTDLRRQISKAAEIKDWADTERSEEEPAEFEITRIVEPTERREPKPPSPPRRRPR
jgi:hypothetical protein